jgi:hypothetical protein
LFDLRFSQKWHLFWGVMPCSLVDICWCSTGIYCPLYVFAWWPSAKDKCVSFWKFVKNFDVNRSGFMYLFGKSQVWIVVCKLPNLTEDVVVFLSHSMQLQGHYLKMGHSHFLLCPFNSLFMFILLLCSACNLKPWQCLRCSKSMQVSGTMSLRAVCWGLGWIMPIFLTQHTPGSCSYSAEAWWVHSYFWWLSVDISGASRLWLKDVSCCSSC